jgi:hypothetical protein
MRYEKGTMELSPARDIPLLQHVLRSGFVTSINCTSLFGWSRRKAPGKHSITGCVVWSATV